MFNVVATKEEPEIESVSCLDSGIKMARVLTEEKVKYQTQDSESKVKNLPTSRAKL